MAHHRRLLPLLLAVAVYAAAGLPVIPAPPVVAFGRVELPDSPELAAPLAARIESAVADALRARGFETVPSEEFETLWQEGLRRAGGYFDVVSGRADPVKRAALRVEALGELAARHGASVLLQPGLVVVVADYQRGKASWDGAREKAAPTGSGEVPALSLELRVEDLSGRETGTSRAGIQLLARYSTWNGKYGPVPAEKLLADEEQLREAVDRALAPVLDALRAAPAAAENVEAASQAAAETAAPLEVAAPPAGARVAALRALRPPPDEELVPVAAQSRYLALMVARLEEHGWWVLPPEAFEQTYHEAALELGGIHDPITGREDADRRVQALDRTRRQLAARYGASVFVTGGIFVRPARFRGEIATWDGVSEQVTDIATWRKMLTTTRGATRALSFGVLLEDVDGKVLHIGFGGIQLAERVERQRFVSVSPELLFADPALDERALDLAFAGWPAGE